MQQYFAKDKDLTLEDSDYHHIKNVMRMGIGDNIKIIFNDVIYTCKLTSINTKIKFDIIDKEISNDDDIKISVAFALIKEQHLNYLLQKCTEVGVNELIPLSTKRTVVKINKQEEEKKIIRWERICKEASEQSFRSNIPVITNIKTIKELTNESYDLKLLCSLNKNTKNLKKVIQKNNKCDRILLVVGPEGGFDDTEECFFNDNDFQSISLGKNVLRAETAPVVAISMIKYEHMR